MVAILNMRTIFNVALKISEFYEIYNFIYITFRSFIFASAIHGIIFVLCKCLAEPTLWYSEMFRKTIVFLTKALLLDSTFKNGFSKYIQLYFSLLNFKKYCKFLIK